MNINQFNLKDNVSLVKNMLQEMDKENSDAHKDVIEKHFGPVTKHKTSHYDVGGFVGARSHIYHTKSGHDIEHISPKHGGTGKHYVEVRKGNKLGFGFHRNFEDAVHKAKDAFARDPAY